MADSSPQTDPPGAPITGGGRNVHVMTKPIGPICNLDCTYCFYLEKENLFAKNERFRMSDAALESYIRQFISLQDGPEVHFAWQGGEPTLLGVEFFQKVVALQEQYGDGRKVSNAIQTNGTLLDDSWCEFLSAHQFLVGISIDGPADLHNTYRVDKRGRDTFEEVMRGVELLKRHRTEFNTLTVVNRKNARDPLRVYRFLKQIGSGFIQFIPLVERTSGTEAAAHGFGLASPPPLDQPATDAAVTQWSVRPRDYGEFLVAIFEEWVRQDVGRVFVQLFDVALGNWVGAPGGLCVFSETCGKALALEHNGDLYACDHYVYPGYKLGNILTTSLGEMAGSSTMRKFGSDKADKLPPYCRACDVRFACHGECPKHRFLLTPDGDPGLNYLCQGYQRFFRHVDPYMKTMGALLRAHRPPAEIMNVLAQRETRPAHGPAGRNDPCPCGSGQKFKRCCGAGRSS